MKILLGCINANSLGGSEMYHYELSRELHLSGNDVTLFTLRPIDYLDDRRKSLMSMGVKQVDLTTININESYDIIVASQPQTNIFVLQNFKNIPIISIIHSEIRSEDPILDPRILHYIAIRQPIADMLINYYKINPNKVSLIYNPINQSRFNTNDLKPLEKVSGIFVGGECNDPIRFPAITHLVENCIQNDWDLYIMSDSRYDFKHPNIKYIDKIWKTEEFLKTMHFTAGILLGRTTLEGWCCGLPGYMYLIDVNGNITNIETNPPSDIVNLCNSEFVVKQHINLYQNILNEY
jgi:hypothetical protein